MYGLTRAWPVVFADILVPVFIMANKRQKKKKSKEGTRETSFNRVMSVDVRAATSSKLKIFEYLNRVL